MACVIAAPSSGSGKTFVSLLLASWARSKDLDIQTFKVGPDYLDAQQLSAVSGRACRNLDLILSGKDWVESNFKKTSNSADLVLIEGVMGLFDGFGSSEKGSTSEIAAHLNLPVVLVINPKGQAASIIPLIKGFIDHNPKVKIAGVVLNRIKSERHKQLLNEILKEANIRVFGAIPNHPNLQLKTSYLGLAPAHEIQNLHSKVESWAYLAEKYLNLKEFKKLLSPPNSKSNRKECLSEIHNNVNRNNILPIAIAEDDAFHFGYQDTKDSLEGLGMPTIKWSPLNDEPIPKEAKALIIPGGFPEKYAAELSLCKRTLSTLKDCYSSKPIYAECGGMLLLGEKLESIDGHEYKMAEILPFNSKRGALKLGYRELSICNKSPISNKGQNLIGHEFHYWEINPIIKSKEINKNNLTNKYYFEYPWLAKGWGINAYKEGWCNNFIHASWIHLHWASNQGILNRWKKSIEIMNGESKY